MFKKILWAIILAICFAFFAWCIVSYVEVLVKQLQPHSILNDYNLFVVVDELLNPIMK